MVCFRMKDGETLKRFCERTGKNYGVMMRRCDQYGWTPDYAVTVPNIKPHKIHYVDFKGEHKLLTRACEAAGVNYESVLSRRFKQSCTVQEAFDYHVARLKRIKNDLSKIIKRSNA